MKKKTNARKKKEKIVYESCVCSKCGKLICYAVQNRDIVYNYHNSICQSNQIDDFLERCITGEKSRDIPT